MWAKQFLGLRISRSSFDVVHLSVSPSSCSSFLVYFSVPSFLQPSCFPIPSFIFYVNLVLQFFLFPIHVAVCPTFSGPDQRRHAHEIMSQRHATKNVLFSKWTSLPLFQSYCCWSYAFFSPICFLCSLQMYCCTQHLWRTISFDLISRYHLEKSR